MVACVVIYSMATSSAERRCGLDFLYDLHRLNAATLLAGALAIIVASPDLIRVSCRTPHQVLLANALCRAWETAAEATAAGTYAVGAHALTHARTRSFTAAGFSTCRKWPAPSTTSILDPGAR
jgi:hypothetical protein